MLACVYVREYECGHALCVHVRVCACLCACCVCVCVRVRACVYACVLGGYASVGACIRMDAKWQYFIVTFVRYKLFII